ncbi:MAG: hypothetical protein KF788_20930 [Piscinibacter sp.]|nr:hypothetical protein [Piscinibacter sp.]
MSIEHIRQSLDQVARHFADHPPDALSRDKAAVSRIEQGLRCRAEGPNGAQLFSDMPTPLSGGGTAPSPGRLMRAALADCDADALRRAVPCTADITVG